jgi:hypothetical protein
LQFYEIQVTLSQYYWTCKRRYSEFKDLHDKVLAAAAPRLLPPITLAAYPVTHWTLFFLKFLL